MKFKLLITCSIIGTTSYADKDDAFNLTNVFSINSSSQKPISTDFLTL